jgi:hypothetical protein
VEPIAEVKLLELLTLMKTIIMVRECQGLILFSFLHVSDDLNKPAQNNNITLYYDKN